MNVEALVRQKLSAIEIAVQSGMEHGGRYEAETFLGVTPPAQPGGPVEVHMCSLVLYLRRTLQHGDGIPLPKGDPSYDVALPSGLLLIDSPAFLRFRHTLWKPNGKLNIEADPNCADVVWVPRRLREYAPWAFQGGAQEVATHLVGSRNLHELFEKKGKVLVV